MIISKFIAGAQHQKRCKSHQNDVFWLLGPAVQATIHYMFPGNLPTSPGPSDYVVCSDESAITQHKYMIVGGLSCATRDLQELNSQVNQIRNNKPFSGDSLQWKRINERKREKYEEVIRLFDELNRNHRLDLTAIVIDTSRLDHKRYNKNDTETFFQKIINEMIEAVARKYHWPTTIRCFHGVRTSKFDLQEIKYIVNSTVQKKRNPLYRPLRQFDYVKVEDSGIHQLNDVFLGAIAYHWNTKMQANTGGAKAKIAKYANSFCVPTGMGCETPWYQKQFDIWELKLREPRA